METAPPTRRFREESLPERTTFRGKTSLAIVLLMVGNLVFIAGLEAAILLLGNVKGFPLVFTVLPIPFLIALVMSLVHESEVTVDRQGVEMRSFPFRGGSAGVYPRSSITDFAWVKTPGRRGGDTFTVKLALRDGRALDVPLQVEGEAESLFVVGRLRAALAQHDS